MGNIANTHGNIAICQHMGKLFLCNMKTNKLCSNEKKTF